MKCVIEACSKKFQRQYEDHHYSQECAFRLKMCLYCSEEYILALEEVFLLAISITDLSFTGPSLLFDPSKKGFFYLIPADTVVSPIQRLI